jgi:methionyl-tRNA synthetase
MSAPVMVISPAPTANGDLHLGHIAGPFLAADVYTRYARAMGRETLFGTGVQDTSTYVVTTAHRLGTTPAELVARSAAEVEKSLAALGIQIDGYTGDEARFTEWVVEFVGRLRAVGALELRAMKFPYSPRTGAFLVDGFVRGGCPFCLADGCAGLCESCGHPVAPGELIEPRSTLVPDDPLELREARVLVLPLEKHRAALREYFGQRCATMRPHMAQAVDELLARPLPGFPVTHPVSWGIPAPFAEVEGQVVNPNAETMAWSMYCTALSAEQRGAAPAAADELWTRDSAWQPVYFLGFDNTYPFAVAGVAMLLALGGRYRLPEQFVTNEFYELDNEKFSTSRGHAVWGAELAAQVPRDLIRFHLAATSPEFQRSDFSRAALDRVAGLRLVQPWNAVAAKAAVRAGGGPLPVSSRSRAVARRIVERFATAYELPHFSVGRAAGILADQLARLAAWEVRDDDAGDFHHQVDVVLRCAAPILIGLADQVLADLSIPAGIDVAAVRPVALPRLPEPTAG